MVLRAAQEQVQRGSSAVHERERAVKAYHSEQRSTGCSGGACITK